MTMDTPSAIRPDLFFAQPDHAIRRGGQMDDDRPLITFAECRKFQELGRGNELTKYGVAMRAPDEQGLPDPEGEVLAMPAELAHKWYGQGYRPCVSAQDHSPYVWPVPPPPTRWLPSMVETAIEKGEPVPEDMAPPGYYGPVLAPPKRRRVVIEQDEPLDISED